MTSITEPEFSSFPRAVFSLTALRERASRHPMGLFAIAAILTAVSISMPAAQAVTSPASAIIETGTEASEPVSERPATEIETACSGQAWGSESINCLVAIAKDGGKQHSARIRTISGV